MRICLCTEFEQQDYFQWHWLWSIDNQVKHNILAESIVINPTRLYIHDDNDRYWQPLKQADIVFVYSSRVTEPSYEYRRSNESGTHHWNWWELAKIAKHFMRPEAKMIAQADDDWIWLEHPDWVWWEDRPDNLGGPEQFFKNTGILEIPDLWFTVLENPYWAKYTNKPIKYMPLPQLWRYQGEMNASNADFIKYGAYGMHKNHSLALLKHSSRKASIFHTISEVAEKVKIPITYFSTQWSEPSVPRFNVPIKSYVWLNREPYIQKLRECLVAIDDADNYVGWSRFAMECAMNYIPCIGSNHSVKIFFPDLYTEHRDFSTQIKLLKELLNNKTFYEEMAKKGHGNMVGHLNPEKLSKEMIRIGKEELGVKSEIENLTVLLLKLMLRKTLPFAIIPKKPSENQIIWDDVHNRVCDRAQWEQWYGRFEEYIQNDKVYEKIIREVLDNK